MRFLSRFRRHIAVADQRVGNMGRLLRRIGLDLETFSWRREGRDMSEAVRICRVCPSVERCNRWLRGTSDDTDGIPEFCPNAKRFARAKSEAG